MQNIFCVAKCLIVISVHYSQPGEKPFFCPSDGCEKTFSSQYSLKSHIRGHDKGPSYSITLSHPLSEVSHSVLFQIFTFLLI